MLPHYYEFGTNVFGGLKAWGVEFVGTVLEPGTNYGAPWLQAGPYRDFATGSSASTDPLAYADFLTVPGHPEFDGQFFDCLTEIRDENGYEWYPSDDVAASVYHGTQQLKRAFDSRVLGTLFTHEYTPRRHRPPPTGRPSSSRSTPTSPAMTPLYLTMDDACRYVRALATSKISAATYDAASDTVSTSLSGHTDLATKIMLYTQDGTQIDEQQVDVPAFTGATEVDTALGGGSRHDAAADRRQHHSALVHGHRDGAADGQRHRQRRGGLRVHAR